MGRWDGLGFRIDQFEICNLQFAICNCASLLARGPAGKELGRTTTDEQGKFSLAAQVRSDHELTVDTGDGHGGHYLIRAAELPDSLPGAVGQVSNAPTSESPASPPSSPENAAPGDPLATQIEQLHRDVQGLREQLDGYEKTTRFRDILGGIGFIVGVTGVAYYVLARKRKL
jgi:nickel transport protein